MIERIKKWFYSLDPKTLENFLKEKPEGIMGGLKNYALSFILPAILFFVVTLFLSTFVGSFLSLLFNSNVPVIGGVLFGIFLSIIVYIISILSTLIFEFIYWIIAKVLGGKGTFSAQYYFNSFFSSAFVLISFLGIIPCIGYILQFAALIYRLYIQFLFFKSFHGLSDVKAALVVLIPIVLGVLIYLAILFSNPIITQKLMNSF